MRRHILLLIIYIVFVLVQVTVIPELLGMLIVPNLIIALGFSFLILGKHSTAMFTALAGGLIQDFVYDKPVGMSALILSVLFYISILIRKYLFRGRVSYFILIAISDYVYMSSVVYEKFIFNPEIFLGVLLCAVSAGLFTLAYRNVIVR